MVLAILPFCLILRTACVWVANYEQINRRILKSKQSVSNRCLEMLICTHLLTFILKKSAALRPTECAASLLLTAQNRRRERRHCAGIVRPHARRAVLLTSSNWTIAKFFSKKSLGFSICTVYGKKVAKRIWKWLSIVLKSRSCVRLGSGEYLWRSMWILWWPATNKSTCGKHWLIFYAVILSWCMNLLFVVTYHPLISISFFFCCFWHKT